MRIIVISDTHNLHNNLKEFPEGDMIIHCGDMATEGTVQEIINFLIWFSNLSCYKYKICIAGNHDWCLEDGHERNKGIFTDKYDIFEKFPFVNYLEHDTIEIEGLKIYGHPYTPWHHGMGFNKKNEDELRKEHEKIPENTDILVTHGGPYGMFDKVSEESNCLGSRSLLDVVMNRKPLLHLFGHIHEDYGKVKVNNTLFVNASIHTWLWKGEPYMSPVVINI